MIVWLAITVGVLFGSGVYLVLRRSAVRIVFGLVLITNAANLLVFAAGGLVRGRPPILVRGAAPADMTIADPLPQAMVLTAIVIGFGLLVFAAAVVERVRREVGSDDTDELQGENE